MCCLKMIWNILTRLKKYWSWKFAILCSYFHIMIIIKHVKLVAFTTLYCANSSCGWGPSPKISRVTLCILSFSLLFSWIILKSAAGKKEKKRKTTVSLYSTVFLTRWFLQWKSENDFKVFNHLMKKGCDISISQLG